MRIAEATPFFRPRKPRLALNVGIVGHRPDRLPAAARPAVATHVAQTLQAICEAAEASHERHRDWFTADEPSLTLISALAEGADSMAADAALAQAFTLDAVLPFARVEYKKDFKESDVRTAFEARLAKARAVLELPGARTDEGKSYEAAGLVVLDNADILIAVWDKGPAKGRGGTPELVAEAARRGMPMIEILADGSAPPRLLWQGLEARQKLAAHVFDHPCAPISSLAPVIDALVKPPETRAEEEGLQRFFDERPHRWNLRLFFPLTKAALFVQAPRLSDLRPQPAKALADNAAKANPGMAPAITDAYGWADAMGSYFAQIFRSAFIGNFAFAAAAVVAAAGALVAHSEIGSLIELAIILWVLFTTSRGVKHRWHEKWVEARELAERLRVAMPMLLLGTRPQAAYGEAQTWTGWYARAVFREAGLHAACLDTNELIALKAALDKLLREQADYQLNACRHASLLNSRLGKFGEILLATTILAVVGHLAFAGWPAQLRSGPIFSSAEISDALSAMTMALPAVGAALFGIRMIGDFEGATRRAHRMELQLKSLSATLVSLPADYHLLRAFSHLMAEVMLGDVESWRLSAESRGLPIAV